MTARGHDEAGGAAAMTGQPFKLTKLDAARRQLNQAIRLWFGDGDPVSVHTLAGSAMQVISDLLKHRGEPDLLFNNPIVKEEMRREYVKAVRSWANFLKHADNDPEGEIEFNPAANDYHLWKCMYGLSNLGEPFDDVEKTFWARFGLEHPEMLTHDIYAGLPPWAVDNARSWTRQEFFDLYMKVLRATPS